MTIHIELKTEWTGQEIADITGQYVAPEDLNRKVLVNSWTAAEVAAATGGTLKEDENPDEIVHISGCYTEEDIAKITNPEKTPAASDKIVFIHYI